MVCLSDFLLFFLRWGKVSNGVNMTPTSYVQLARGVYHWKIIICDGTWDDWWFFTLQIIMNTVVYFSFFLLFSLYHFVAPDKVFHGYNSSCSWLAFLQDHLKSQWNEWMGYSHLELETLSWETATLTPEAQTLFPEICPNPFFVRQYLQCHWCLHFRTKGEEFQFNFNFNVA